MSQGSTSQELQSQSQELLQGPLKHARTAALALALVPLAAVAVTTQVNEKLCVGAGICGTVFYDTNDDGVQDAGEPGIPGVSVTIRTTSSTARETDRAVDTNGARLVRLRNGSATVGRSPTRSPYRYRRTRRRPRNDPGDRRLADSDGDAGRHGNSVAHFTSTGPRTNGRIPAPTSASRRPACTQPRNRHARILEESS